MTPSARHYRRVCSAARIAALTAAALLAGLAGAGLPALAQGDDPATGAKKVNTWSARLSPDADDTNVRFDVGGLRLDARPAGPASIRSDHSEGMLITEVHPLTQFSSQVVAQVVAERPAGSAVDVDVRGPRGDGSWTEWVPAGTTAPAMLGAAVTAVQARVVLRAAKGGASPVVSALRLTDRKSVV